MTWLASTPGEINMESARRTAEFHYDDAACSRLLKLAGEVHRELRCFQSEPRARNMRALVVAQICGAIKTQDFLKDLDKLIGDPEVGHGEEV